jgi:gluconokinase
LETGLPQGALAFVLLEGSKELIAKRLAARKHEYMNPDLLDSQLATLEPPANALCIVNDRTPDEVVSQILAHISPQQN